MVIPRSAAGSAGSSARPAGMPLSFSRKAITCVYSFADRLPGSFLGIFSLT